MNKKMLCNNHNPRGFFALIFLFFLSTSFLFAQNNNGLKVIGKVIDENNIPLVGATVLEVGTSNGAITDFDGEFEIEVNSKSSIIEVSYIGYQTKRIEPTTEKIMVQLIPDVTSLNEVVLIGYGESKAKDLTGSLSVVKMDEVQSQPSSNIGDAIQGRAAGVTVITSGQPGNNPTIRIRGIGTIGNNDPLIVVDGMPLNGGLNQVNMKDVESLQVL